jgi:beta-galactosidase
MNYIKIVAVILCCLLCNKGFSAEPTYQLTDFFVKTTTNAVDVAFLINNPTATAQKGVVRLNLIDASGKTFLALPQQQLVLEAGATKKVNIGKQQINPKLWSPEHPNLYSMQINVMINGKLEVTATRKIGFKLFEIKGHLLYLNGKPYYLRALSQWPVGRVLDKKGVSAPEVWSDEQFVKKFFQKIKSLHINAGRIGDHPLWVKYADSLGVLNITGSYTGAGGSDDEVFPRNKREFTPKIIYLRNHVSTAMYTLANEVTWTKNQNFLRLAKENYEFAKTLDPTRPMIANAGFGKGKVGDIEDLHDYTGWYGGTILDMDDYEKSARYKKDGGSKQPITYTECVGAYTAEHTGRFHLLVNKGLSNALRHVGRGGQYPEDPLWYQRVITKEMLEGMRRGRGMDSRLSGSFPFSDYWMWDVPNKSFIAKPAAEVLAQVYSPVLLSFKAWNRHALEGKQISGDLYIVNDDIDLGSLTNATVTVSLAQNGKILKNLKLSVPTVGYYGTVKIPVSMSIPFGINSGEAKLLMKLNHPKAQSVENETDIFIAKKDFLTTASPQHTLVLDQQGNTTTALRNIGVNTERCAVANLSKSNSLVIGAKTLGKLSNKEITEVLTFVDNGGRVLVLEQEIAQLNNSSLLSIGIKAKSYRSLFVNTERPGLLDEGLRNRDFFLWNQTKRASGFPTVSGFDVPSRSLASIAILANCGPVLQNAVVFEYFKGKGSIIFSQFELIDRVNSDPIAAKVLSNLIKYLHATAHSFGQQVKTEITFADLDSEAGLFGASLKQGMVINSHNYGMVSWEKNNWPDGRRVVGEQKIMNSLGYIGAIKPSDTASGFFYLHPPVGAETFYLQVKNPVGKPLWFDVLLNDEPAGESVIVAANTVHRYGPWKIPLNKGSLKVTIRSHSDLGAKKREKPIIEELVFQKMLFK